MINKEVLKKQIIYRSTHRGSKEMDILLGNFVKKYVDNLTDEDLANLDSILKIEDEILYNWYFYKNNSEIIPKNKISKLLKEFKL
tara:strand:+ start:4877 stop:5131 length:255 start_codon:yes stop_codon:yes gene_type:complete